MTRHFVVLPLVLFLIPGASSGRSSDPVPVMEDPDEGVVRRAGHSVDAASLLRLVNEFTRTRPAVDDAALERLVDQLGHEDFGEREQASRALVALGRPVLARLRRLTNHADAEVARRAAGAIAEIEAALDPLAVRSATRLLVRRRVPGSVGALLAYLPDAGPDGAEEVIAIRN